MEDADLVVLNTCHIREKAAEKVFSELGRVRALKRARAPRAGETTDRRRRLRRAGGGPGDPAPRAGRRRRRRAAELSPSAGPAARAAHASPVVDTDFPVEDKFDHLPAAAARHDPQPRRVGLPHRPGRLRQVLHLLRRALYARRGGLAAGGEDLERGRSGWRDAGRARDHAHRPERQRLSRRRAGRPRPGRSGACCAASPTSPASPGCATRRATRATWTTSSSRPTATCRR